MFDKDDDEIIGWLESQGAVIWEGVADDGEAIFKFDLKVLKDIMPELYEDIMKDIESDLVVLYEEGLVDVEYDENLNAKFKISQKGEEWAKENGFPIQEDLPPFLE